MRFLILLMLVVAVVGCGEVDSRGDDTIVDCDEVEALAIASEKADGFNGSLAGGGKDGMAHLCHESMYDFPEITTWCYWEPSDFSKDTCHYKVKCTPVPEADIDQARAEKCS